MPFKYNPITLIHDYRYGDFKTRNHITSLISMLGNFVISVFKIVIGLLTMSFFFIISGFYSIGIGVAKQIYFKGYELSVTEKQTSIKHYLLMAIILMMTSIIYIIYMIRLFFVTQTFNYTAILGISIATVSFLELGMAIRGLIKSRKMNDLLFTGLKTINFSSALVAIVLTQTALLSFSSDAEVAVINYHNAIFGVSVGVITLALSLFMIYRYNVVKKTVDMNVEK